MSAFARKRLSLGIGVTTLVILASVLAFALAFGPLGQREAAAAGARTYTSRYAVNGDEASYGFYASDKSPTPLSPCWMVVDVSRGGTVQAQTTQVYYDIALWDPDYKWWEEWGPPYPDPLPEPGGCRRIGAGAGQVPNSAYSVNGSTHTLYVDTSKVPDYQLWVGSGGVISVKWEKTGTYESRSTGTFHQRSPTGSSSWSGTDSDSSATAQGTILGQTLLPVPEGAGEKEGTRVGWSKGVSACRSTDPDVCY